MLFSKLILARSIMDCSTKNKTLKPNYTFYLYAIYNEYVVIFMLSPEHSQSFVTESKILKITELWQM